MWLFTPFGFFSIVCKPGDAEAGRLTVRARVATDLDALRAKYLPELGPTLANAASDYPFRARAPRQAVATAMARIAGDIDYANFKDRVAGVQGLEREHVYGKVWSVLHQGLQSLQGNGMPKAHPKANGSAKVWHPRPGDDGKPVLIDHPTLPTPLAAWEASLATVVPDGPLPAELNGIATTPWTEAPTTTAGWNALAQAMLVPEPPFQPAPGYQSAAGAVVREPDGRVWVVHPTNGFAGYHVTFPKGTVQHGLSLQASALKECLEEAGLRVQLLGFLVDCDRSQSRTRYYLARRIGGSPAAMDFESQAVSLVPAPKLSSMVTHHYDQPILAALAALPGG